MTTAKFYQFLLLSKQLFKHVLIMFLFGISAGIPLLLIFSSLGLWLREAGIDRATVTLFSWAALGYSFKFIWAPLVDKLPIPLLTNLLGRRRAWLLVTQISIIVAIFWLASNNPVANQMGSNSLTTMALAAVLLGFSSASQDIVIDAYRIESAKVEFQTIMASAYVSGYRLGMFIAGAGSLFLASYFGSIANDYNYQAWQTTYQIMAGVMLLGVATTLLIAEPKQSTKDTTIFTSIDYLRLGLIFILAVGGLILVFAYSGQLVSASKATLTQLLANKALASFIIETLRLMFGLAVAILIAIFATKFGVARPQMVQQIYVVPVKDFFSRYGLKLALIVLSLVGLYRISDIVLGVVANLFYQDLGFSKVEIATIVKSFGLIMTITGGFAGGLIAVKYGVMRTLLLGAILTVITNLLFIVLAQSGPDIRLLYVVISADNLTGGIATTAFIAFLSQLTNIKFTATQYAIFSSLMTLIPKVIGGYSGAMVNNIGYGKFFLVASLLGMPIIFLVVVVNKKLKSLNS